MIVVAFRPVQFKQGPISSFRRKYFPDKTQILPETFF